VRSTEREALRVRGGHDPPFHAGRLWPLATVVAVRHAQADRPTGVDDFDRVSPPSAVAATRGRHRLADEAVRPGLIVCSPARRAVETLDELVTAYAAEPPAFYAESCTTSVPTWLRLWVAGLLQLTGRGSRP
jgi:phosphohistidine phosphatase SixA